MVNECFVSAVFDEWNAEATVAVLAAGFPALRFRRSATGFGRWEVYAFRADGRPVDEAARRRVVDACRVFLGVR